MKITNVKVYDLEESIVASGFPMDTGELRDNFQNECISLREYLEYRNSELKVKDFYSEKQIEKCKKHIDRAMKLGKAKNGSGHDSTLKGIIVNFNIEYTQYFSMQMQRYHFIDFVSSSSKMHKLLNMDLSNLEKDCDVDKVVADHLRDLIQHYHYRVNESRVNEKEKQKMFMNIIKHVPAGFKQHARMTTNYLQLKTIYFQRRNHKTTDWQIFCNWIETLPLFKELVIM